MASGDTVSVTEFKANCLKLLDELATRKRSRLVITKRGRAIAVVKPHRAGKAGDGWYGFMRGSVIAPPGFDFTKPALDEPLDAERGILRR